MGKKNEYAIFIKIAMGIVLFIIGYPVIKKIVNGLKDSQNVDNAVSNAAGAVARNNPPAGSTSVRALKIKGWADSLNALFKSWNNHSADIVDILNAAGTAQDVAALSDYYVNTYGVSLLAEVNKELGSTWNVFGKGWNNLTKIVQNNLT